MKGNISLKQFIQEVKQELIDAQDSSNPFYELHEVQLEVSFTLELEGGGKAKFVVVEVGAKTNASQLHRVTIKFIPLGATAAGLQDSSAGAATQPEKPGGAGGSGRGGGGGFLKPVYAPRKL